MKLLKTLLLLPLFLLFQCGEKTENDGVTTDSVPVKNTVEEVTDSIHLNKIEKFSSPDEQTFTCHDYKLVDTEGILKLYYKDKFLKDIDFGGIIYEGPGYSIYLYSAINQLASPVILIEAQADPGTAWYYAVILEDHVVKKEQIIKEPRSDSERYALEDFISITRTKDRYIFNFKKSLIAKYSNPSPDIQEKGSAMFIVIPRNESLQQTEKSGINKESESLGDENRTLVHLYFANGGFLAFYSDNTVTGCPRCELTKENVENLKNEEALGTYKSEKDYLVVKRQGQEDERMDFYKDGNLSEDWAKKDGKWQVELE